MDSAPDIPTSPVIYEVSSKTESLFTVRPTESTSEVEISLSIDSFGPYRYDLNLSDLELGDRILVHQDDDNQIHTCRLVFESFQYCKYLQDLVLINSELTPSIFSLYSLGTLAHKLPSYGYLDILHTCGSVRIIKYNDSILRLSSKQIQPIEYNPYLYIPSQLTATMNAVITTSAELTNKPEKPAVYNIIACHEEKQEFTARPYTKRATCIIIKISELNISEVQWRFEDINQKTHLSPILDNENETISYEVVLKTVKSIKKIENFYEFDIKSKGKISILEHELGEFKDIIASEPEDVKVKCSLKTIEAFVYKNCIYRQPTYTPIKQKETQNITSSLSIQIGELLNHMNIHPDKLTIISSVFSHAKLLEGSQNTPSAFYTAVAIGYLTHLARASTASNNLTNFIHQLKTRHVVGAKLKSEERFKSLIEHLESLQSNRSLTHLQSLLNESEILKALIKEFKQMIKLHRDSIEIQKERNKHRKIVALSKILSKELNILIIFHSPFIVKPFNIWEGRFEVIINLVFNSWIWNKVYLLYYEYHHAEDNSITIDLERFKCLDCKKLPHQVYFTSPDMKRCQRCIFREEKGHLRSNKKIEGGINKGKNKLVETRKLEEAIKHQKNRKLEEEKEVMRDGNRCEGCKVECPENETCTYSGCCHLLCYRCLIASDEQYRCVACKQRMSIKNHIKAKARLDSGNMIVNPIPVRKDDASLNKKHTPSEQVHNIAIQDTEKLEQGSDIRVLNQIIKPNTNNQKQVADTQHKNPTNSKRRKRGKKLYKPKDNNTQ